MTPLFVDWHMDRHKKEIEVLPFAAVCVCVAALTLLLIQGQFSAGHKTESTGSVAARTDSESIADTAAKTVAFAARGLDRESAHEPVAGWRSAADRLKADTCEQSPGRTLPAGCTAGW
jgi:hypothetical protein